MAIDWSVLELPKSKPGVIHRKAKQREAAAAWRRTAKAVDARDAEDGAPTCFITGRRLQTANAVNEWTFRDRAHIEARSTNPKRKHDPKNVLSVSRAVHKLIDSSALFLLTKRLQEAKSVRSIYCVAWNRRMVPKGKEPCRLRKGLPVVELDQVRD